MAASPGVERLLNVIMTIGSRRRITREVLFEAIPDYRGAASPASAERMFERDKAEILALGLSLVSERDPWDESIVHYRIERPAGDRDVSLTREQYTVLLAASRAWDAATAGGAARRVRAKLLSLGMEPDEQLLRVTPEASIESLPVLSPLLQAAQAARAVRFSYRRADGTVAERTVEPWEVAMHGGGWYVLGHDRAREGVRLFRASRIESFPRDIGAAKAPRDRGASVAEAIAAVGAGADERSDAVLRIDPDKALALRDRAGAPPSVPEIRLPGIARLEARQAVLSHARWAELVEPQPWRTELAEIFARIAELHEGTPEPDALEQGERRPRARIRVTPSSTDQLSRLISEVSYVLARGEVPISRLADEFAVTEEQVAEDMQVLYLCGDLGGGFEDLIETHWEDGWVRVANADALETSLRLTGTETTALLAGLAALSPADATEERLIDGARQALIGAEHAGRAGGPEREAVPELAAGPELSEARPQEPRSNDHEPSSDGPGRGEAVAAGLRRAIAADEPVVLRYSPPDRPGTMLRRVHPRSLAASDGRGYVHVSDLTPGVDGATRKFRFDRIVRLESPETEVPPLPKRPEDDSAQSTVVRLAPPAAWIADVFDASEVRDLPGGGTIAVLARPIRAALIDAVLEAHGDAELLAPQSWRAEAQAVAAGAARRHASPETLG